MKGGEKQNPQPRPRSRPVYLGEGSYGCVHYPALHCLKHTAATSLNPPKVSKIMTDDVAEEELNAYALVQQADPTHQYHLGPPKTCRPDFSDAINMAAIRRCGNRSEFMKNKPQVTLVLMEYGGVNLEEFARAMRKLRRSPSSVERMELFWIEAHRLFLGINQFLKRSLVHHDLKPINVVYDEANHRCNFIDFGLMDYIPQAMTECRENQYGFNFNYWCFPLETSLLHRRDFQRLHDATSSEKVAFVKHVVEGGMKDGWLTLFFKEFHIVGRRMQTSYLHEFEQFVLTEMDHYTYDQFLERYFKTLDVFGLALALAVVLDNCKHLLDSVTYQSLDALLREMHAANLNVRPTIDAVLLKYEGILLSSGITNRHRMLFEQNRKRWKSLSTQHQETLIQSLVERSHKSTPKQLNRRKPCPVGQVLNLNTGRCLKRVTLSKTLKKRR